jgi:predicted TIM-barrel fold metal-dependent hydrolase
MYQTVVDEKEKKEHSPTLKTILMVEKAIKNSEDSASKVADLKRSLPRQVNHNTLMTILEYLENSHKILFSSKGIIWTESNEKLADAIRKGRSI